MILLMLKFLKNGRKPKPKPLNAEPKVPKKAGENQKRKPMMQI